MYFRFQILFCFLLLHSSLGDPISFLSPNQTSDDTFNELQAAAPVDDRIQLGIMTDFARITSPKLTHWPPTANFTNFYQFLVYGPAGMLAANYSEPGDALKNQASCQKYESEATCEAESTLDKKFKCNWCNIPKEFKERFGDGTCMMALLYAGCVFPPKATFPYIIDLGDKVKFPQGYEQAACMPYSHNKSECETGLKKTIGGQEFKCSFCEFPPVYHLNPSSICFQDFMMDPFCKFLQDVPEKIIKKFKDAAELAKQSTTPRPTTTTAKTTTTPPNATPNQSTTTSSASKGSTTTSSASNQSTTTSSASNQSTTTSSASSQSTTTSSASKTSQTTTEPTSSSKSFKSFLHFLCSLSLIVVFML